MAYRLAVFHDGKWRWAAGCGACDEIRRLRQLLSEGIHVYEGESADTLRRKLDRAEAEIERLNQLLTTS